MLLFSFACSGTCIGCTHGTAGAPALRFTCSHPRLLTNNVLQVPFQLQGMQFMIDRERQPGEVKITYDGRTLVMLVCMNVVTAMHMPQLITPAGHLQLDCTVQ